MKKTILAAASFLACLFAFGLIFGANVYGGQLVLPDPNAKLSETVNIEPIAELLAMRPFEYKIRRGDNLTKLAKTFGTTVDALKTINEGNSDVKNKNLILAGGKLRVPLYSAESVKKMVRFHNNEMRSGTEYAYKNGQYSAFPAFAVVVAFLILILFLFVFGLVNNGDLKRQVTEARTKNADLSKKLWETEDKLKTLETEFKHVHLKLDLAHEQLRLKEGADEEIKRQKTENDRLVERVSTLYMDNEMISVNLAEARAKIENLETDLQKKVSVGDTIGLESQENGKIIFKIIKIELNKEGKPGIYVACPEEACLVNVVKSLKAENALSHVFKAHGTSQDARPNGFKE